MPDVAVSTPISAPIMALVQEASDGKLAIFAGAGLSKGLGLPDGSELATILHDSFKDNLEGYSCEAPSELVAVAAAVDKLPNGTEVLQNRIVQIGRFKTAPPNHAHRLIALLIAEGALNFLTTNWDDCVERGWTHERIYAACDGQEVEELQRPFVLKLHGCCSRPATLLITRKDVDDPAPWARGSLAGQINSFAMVFVEVGDIAEYVRKEIEELAQWVDNARVRVVSRRIVNGWDDSQWSSVLPNLPQERKIAMSADDFVTELARGWVQWLVQRAQSNGLQASMRQGFDSLAELNAEEALSWLRRVAREWPLGKSIVTSSEAFTLLASLPVLTCKICEQGQNCDIQYVRQSNAVTMGENRVNVFIGPPSKSAKELERMALSIAEDESYLSGRVAVTVLCSAAMPFGARNNLITGVDILSGEAGSSDLIDGPANPEVRLFWADKLVEEVS